MGALQAKKRALFCAARAGVRLDELEADEDEEWLENEIRGVDELLRFSPIRQLLHR